MLVRIVLCLIGGLLVPALGTPASAESLPLLETVPLHRGLTFSAALPKATFGLDPPQWTTTQVFAFGRGGGWYSSQQYSFQFEPWMESQTGPTPEWAKSRPAVGLAYRGSGNWTAAIEYTRRKDQSHLIDRGWFNSGKLFAGIGYQYEQTTAYVGLSRGLTAGIHWRGRDGAEAAFTFVTQSPNRDIRSLFDGQTSGGLRNVVTLTYRKPF